MKNTFDYHPAIKVEASPFITAQIARVNNNPHIFLANFKGLKNDEITQQLPEENISITFPPISDAKIYYLPFLGKKIELKGELTDNQLICTLPTVEKGAVVWIE
jgi:hypothetical protein